MNKTAFLQRFHSSPPLAGGDDYPLKHAGRAAGVLVPLIDRPEGLSVLLTQRALHLAHHPGQISFPGGKQEEQDKDLIDTALREAWEEINLPRQNCNVIGLLPEHRTITGFCITAVVAIVDPDFTLQYDTNEVSDAFEVPLAFLLDTNNYVTEHFHRGTLVNPVHFIPWHNRMIWGATAAILRNLASIFTDTP
ncbi:CoA pyrophosphatase [Alteromonas lipolytica]|uniref:Coenzyme A pyrophosphatase n=1 Tax=Alteromonas lipolytica TaxID=1856405 RepID=A0A1E8FGR2_9ALTE|nr:CoA pyrophosphatase [Alteromonas lipolytica]OFI35132.1 coenzyme A pyrophosphatase [Alteromonas lipolytica]GGF56967.1 coenzyme A pyrophosphatase [Alteromonas lipolytica]